MAAEMLSEAALPKDCMPEGKIKGPTNVEPSPFICDARSNQKRPRTLTTGLSGSSLIQMETSQRATVAADCTLEIADSQGLKASFARLL